MENIKTSIKTEYIKLDQLLKFAGIAESGAEAKDMILDGIVSVTARRALCAAKKYGRATMSRLSLRTKR